MHAVYMVHVHYIILQEELDGLLQKQAALRNEYILSERRMKETTDRLGDVMRGATDDADAIT